MRASTASGHRQLERDGEVRLRDAGRRPLPARDQVDIPGVEVRIWGDRAVSYELVPGGDDAAFARELYRAEHVTVLPGSFLARDAANVNPGQGFVRIALVDNLEACVEAARRIVRFAGKAA